MNDIRNFACLIWVLCGSVLLLFFLARVMTNITDYVLDIDISDNIVSCLRSYLGWYSYIV